MTSLPAFTKEDQWPLYRRPRKQLFLPPISKITHLSLPTTKRSDEAAILKIDKKKDLFEQIFEHYDGPLPECERYGNYCGEHIATRRHEVLDCDPYFGGLKEVGKTAYLIVFDERFKSSWCLAPGLVQLDEELER